MRSKLKWINDPKLKRLNDSARPEDVLKHMAGVVGEAQKTKFIYDVARNVAPDNFEAIPAALFHRVSFLPDTGQHQIIQFPHRLYRTGEGNCVDFTVFIASCAKALNLPVTMRMVNFGRGFEHVYPVVNGQIYDLNYWMNFTPGQKKSLPGVGYLNYTP